MLMLMLCLIFVFSQAAEAQTCQSNYPIAYMCQNSTVQGPGVTLDVSTAADTMYTSCSCTVNSNITGFLVDFGDNPTATDCGAQLDLFFDDISMSLKCGVPSQGQSTTGSSALITLTRDADVANIDSLYCLSFHANRSDIELTLTCEVGDQMTSSSAPITTESTMETSVQTTSNGTSIINSSSDSTIHPTSSTKMVQTSQPWPASGTSTTLQTSSSQVSSTYSEISTTDISTTLPTSTAEPESTTSQISNKTPPFSVTANTNAVTTTVNPVHNTTGTSSGSADTSTYIDTFTDPETTPNSDLTSTTAQPSTTVSRLNNTSTTSTSFSTSSLDNTTVVTQTTFTFSNNTTPVQVVNQTTQYENRTENATQTTDKAVTTDIHNNYTTVSSNTSTSVYNTTTEYPDVSTILSKQTTDDSSTITTIGTNITQTTVQSTVTTTKVSGNTTMETNTSDSLNTTDIPAQTTEAYSNHTAETNTTDSVNTTNAPGETQTTEQTNITSTESYKNDTINTNTTISVNTTAGPKQTTDQSNATTTGLYNETVSSNTTSESNDTIIGNTTAKPERTTNALWEPPYQDYDVPSRSKNIVTILVPVAGILLLIFITVVVSIMCKRSRDAKRKTMIPNNKNKANRNPDTAGGGNTTASQKPANPADIFTTQSNGKYPAKYKTENETIITEKNNLISTCNAEEDKLLREEFNNTLNGSLLSDTTTPKQYEPSEREKDLMGHLELSSIVIESDPNDPNRYFKKSDPGDWYRVIMKGKKSRDSKTKDEKRTRTKKNKTRSSGSDNESGQSKHRRKKHRDRRERSQSDLGLAESNKRKAKNRHSSSDSFDKTLSENESGMIESVKSNQPRLVVSKPGNKNELTRNEPHLSNNPRQVFSTPANVIETRPEPVQTRKVISMPSSAKMPSPLLGNSSGGAVMQINSKSGGDHVKDEHLNGELSNDSFSNPNSQRNTPLRSSQTRNNLFGSKTKAENTSKEKDGNSKLEVKRPDIVPPLNLTDTGDRVGRMEDGFEEFLLSEC